MDILLDSFGMVHHDTAASAKKDAVLLALTLSHKMYPTRESHLELVPDYRPTGRTFRRTRISRIDATASLSWRFAENRQYNLVYRQSAAPVIAGSAEGIVYLP
jgi:hypothetical protein